MKYLVTIEQLRDNGETDLINDISFTSCELQELTRNVNTNHTTKHTSIKNLDFTFDPQLAKIGQIINTLLATGEEQEENCGD